MSDITHNFYSKRETLEKEIKDKKGLESKCDKKVCNKCSVNLRGNRGWVQGCGHFLCSACTLDELKNGKNACPMCGTEVHYAKSQVMYFPTEDEEKEEAVEEKHKEKYHDNKEQGKVEVKDYNTVEEEEQFTTEEKEQFTENDEKEQMTVMEEEQILGVEKEPFTDEENNEAIKVVVEQETQEDEIKQFNIEEKDQIMDEKNEQMTDEDKEEVTKEDVKEKNYKDASKKEKIEDKEQIMDEEKEQISVEDKIIKGGKKETMADLKKKPMKTQPILNRIGLRQPLVPSPQMAEFLGINEGDKITTSECVKKTWTYIKKKKLLSYKDRYDEHGFVKPNKEMAPIFGNQPFKSIYIQQYIMKHLHN